MTLLDLLRLHQRRTFLGQTARGLGGVALASLLTPRAFAEKKPSLDADKWPGVVKPLHFPAKAKRVIWLCMAGGPSHLETFDHKPKLAEMSGKPMPESFTKGQPIAQLQGQALQVPRAAASVSRSSASPARRCASLFPHIGTVADESASSARCTTEAINHDPAHTFMNTGTTISGRPAMGSWVTYGLGSDCDNLPGFVVLTSKGRGGQNQPIASRQWHSGFLPSRFQGVHLRGQRRSGAVPQQPRRRRP